MLRTQHHSLDRPPFSGFLFICIAGSYFFLLNRWITAVIAAFYCNDFRRCFTSCGVSSCPSNFCSAVWAGCFGTEPNQKQYQSHAECVSTGGLDSPVFRGPTSFRIWSNASSRPMVWTRQVKGRTIKTTSLLKQQCITVAYNFIQLLLKGWWMGSLGSCKRIQCQRGKQWLLKYFILVLDRQLGEPRT